MKYVVFCLTLLLMASLVQGGTIGIGVMPSKVELDFTKSSSYTIGFKFFNQGTDDAIYELQLPEGLNVQCDWCNEGFLVRAGSYYTENYTYGEMTFLPSPSGRYTIKVLGRPENVSEQLVIIPSVGIVIDVYNEEVEEGTEEGGEEYEPIITREDTTTTTTTTLIGGGTTTTTTVPVRRYYNITNMTREKVTGTEGAKDEKIKKIVGWIMVGIAGAACVLYYYWYMKGPL